jgi:hypothetical protein
MDGARLGRLGERLASLVPAPGPGGGMVVEIGMATCGRAAGAGAVAAALGEALEGRGRVVEVGCMGSA